MKLKKAKKFTTVMDALKHNKLALLVLIIIDGFMAVTSNIVDWPWLMSVEWYLMPFTPICSLFPLTLAIWFTIYLFRKKVPTWFTTFIFIGIISYGLMAFIYFPLYMNWAGFKWMGVGNMIWVFIYAIQSLIIASEVHSVKKYQFILIITYFVIKDICDRYFGTFIDFRQPGYPVWLMNLLGVSMIIIQGTVFTLTAKLIKKQSN